MDGMVKNASQKGMISKCESNMYAKPHSYIFVMQSSTKNVGMGEDLFVNLT